MTINFLGAKVLSKSKRDLFVDRSSFICAVLIAGDFFELSFVFVPIFVDKYECCAYAIFVDFSPISHETKCDIIVIRH
jgi:hypothetical protein